MNINLKINVCNILGFVFFNKVPILKYTFYINIFEFFMHSHLEIEI